MNNDFTPPQQRAAWKRLQSLANPSLPHLRELLADPAGERQASLQLEVAGLQLDASRQQVTPEVLQAASMTTSASTDRPPARMMERIANPLLLDRP